MCRGGLTEGWGNGLKELVLPSVRSPRTPSFIPANCEPGLHGRERTPFPPASRPQASEKAGWQEPRRQLSTSEFLIPWDHGPFLPWEPRYTAPVLGCHKGFDPRQGLAPSPFLLPTSHSPVAISPKGLAERKSSAREFGPWLPCVVGLPSSGGTRSESLGSHGNDICLPGCLSISPGWRHPPSRAVGRASGIEVVIPGRASPLTEQGAPCRAFCLRTPQGSGGGPQVGQITHWGKPKLGLARDCLVQVPA